MDMVSASVVAARIVGPAADFTSRKVSYQAPDGAGSRDASKMRAAQEALRKLKETSVNQVASRRTQAVDRIQRLKTRLKALTAVPGGDPRVRAREAARIAKELAAAAREYVDAARAEMSASQSSQPVSPTPSEATVQAEASAAASSAQGEDATPAAGGEAAPAATAAPTQTAGASGDDPVIADIKDMSRKARAILEAELSRVRAKAGRPEFEADRLRSTADKAARDIEQAGQDLKAPLAPAVAGYAPASTPPAPSISIHA